MLQLIEITPDMATADIKLDHEGCLDSLGAIFLSMQLETTPDFHVQVCKMLFYITADEQSQTICAQTHYLAALDSLFMQHVTNHETSAVEHIGAVWAQLAHGPGAHPVANHLAQGSGLQAVKAAFTEFTTEVVVQRVLICVIASTGVSSQVKLQVAQAGMLDCVVHTMRRFVKSEELQEQGCRAINAISKGEEKVKEYLADRATAKGDDHLPVMEAIIDAMSMSTHVHMFVFSANNFN